MLSGSQPLSSFAQEKPRSQVAEKACSYEISRAAAWRMHLTVSPIHWHRWATLRPRLCANEGASRSLCVSQIV